MTIAGQGWNPGGGTGPLGALRLDNATYNGPITLAANAAISNQAYTGPTHITGNISGPYQLQILPRVGSWTSTVYLAGNDTYGSTLISGGAAWSGGIGQLIASSSTALSSGALTMDGGILQLNGYNFSFANLSDTGVGGTIENGAATPAVITVGTDGTSTSYGGTFINGGAASLGLRKTGAGTLTLTATGNSYSGPTTVNAGVLQVGTGGAGQDGTIDSTSGVAINANAGLVFNLAGTDTAAYAISGSGALSMVGPGELILSGTNTYTGGTTVSNGTVVLTNNEAIADGSSLTVGNPSAFAAPVVPSAVAAGSSVVAGLQTAPQTAIAPVPEPGTLALLIAMLGAAATYRRLRRR
jgi:autotransporter-associated beta strand protein